MLRAEGGCEGEQLRAQQEATSWRKGRLVGLSLPHSHLQEQGRAVLSLLWTTALESFLGTREKKLLLLAQPPREKEFKTTGSVLLMGGRYKRWRPLTGVQRQQPGMNSSTIPLPSSWISHQGGLLVLDTSPIFPVC